MNSTRFEQVGLVFDFGPQDNVIIVAVMLFFMAILGIMVFWAISPFKSEASRRTYIANSLKIGAATVLTFSLFAGFLFGKIYTLPIFPKPVVTDDKILAESVYAIARSELRKAYGQTVAMDVGSPFSSDQAEYRSADPSIYPLNFTISVGDVSRACKGSLTIEESISGNQEIVRQGVSIDPSISEPLNMYAPVTLDAGCE